MVRIAAFLPPKSLNHTQQASSSLTQLFQRTTRLLFLTLCTSSAHAEEISFQTQEEDGSTAQSSTSATFDPLPIILTFTIAGTVVATVGVVYVCCKRGLLPNCTLSFRGSNLSSTTAPAPTSVADVEMNARSTHRYENAPPTAPLPAASPSDPAADLKISVKRQSQRESPDGARERIPRSKTVSTSNPATGQRTVVSMTPSSLESQTSNNNNAKSTDPVKHQYENIPDTVLLAGSDLANSLKMAVERPSQIESSGAAHHPIPKSLRRATTGQPQRIPSRVVFPSLQSRNNNENPSTPYAPFEESSGHISN